MKRTRNPGKTSRKKSTALPANPDAILQLRDAARRKELVVIIGTGVSMGLTQGKVTTLSWKGLIQNGFSHGVTKGKISAAQAKIWEPHLNTEDLDDLLGAAEFMSRKLGAPQGDLYARWLESVFKSVQPTNQELEKAIKGLNNAAIPIATLNYDPLLELVTGLPAITLAETKKVTSWMRRESPGIFHLHGFWESAPTCILGIRDYETTLSNEVRDLMQRSLATFRRLLFIGCGGTFADPNFTALIQWLRAKMPAAALQHFALVPEKDVVARHADPAWQGFVDPLSFGSKHEDLAPFLLKNLVEPLQTTTKTKSAPTKSASSTDHHAALLAAYRSFLIKDCGQMTIEGVRADMDTAQRRFDLERLFVPLKVSPSPPDIPESDPDRKAKMEDWMAKNKDPMPFGRVFAQHKHIALLALPGGGKTLLLKRLAVAYADPNRRTASSDNLPNLDAIPVLIRCREWREHLHRPILTLLQHLPAVTGQPSLAGVSEALVPLFRKGKAILLIDGLDEIHDDALRSTFVDHVEKFFEEYPTVRLIVTSREAGFSLVAPCLARFCQRWRVAPLEKEAIESLCHYWHILMKGDSPESQAEGSEVAKTLLGKSSLHRLAENPLLLTMLLVVKHGAGRLPPDRVSLYQRAVEVLLDTWNIKGHEPLNAKEAVPQLAYLAFQLLRAGKQTATEKELLTLLEEARERVPQIRRFAKDSPHEFLRRVELRSSLLIEAGRQKEGSGTVPFYQFRHLTFQEYLAAVAAVEGHYPDYAKTDTILTPLAPFLLAEEWKVVIPMAAVLARKQAEPLLAQLVKEGEKLREKMNAGEDFEGNEEWRRGSKMPAAVSRIAQCMVEEAEISPETLISALQLIAVFAKGCRSDDDWGALCRGPYGEDLFRQAWMLFEPMQWNFETRLNLSGAMFAALREPVTHWMSPKGQADLMALLNSDSHLDVGRCLLTCAGLWWIFYNREADMWLPPLSAVRPFLFHENPAIWTLAAWEFAFIQSRSKNRPGANNAVLSRLASLWLTNAHMISKLIVGWALSHYLGLRRHSWTPVLSEANVQEIRKQSETSDFRVGDQAFSYAASILIAFHAGKVWSDTELAEKLADMKASDRFNHIRKGSIDKMLTQLNKLNARAIKEA